MWLPYSKALNINFSHEKNLQKFIKSLKLISRKIWRIGKSFFFLLQCDLGNKTKSNFTILVIAPVLEIVQKWFHRKCKWQKNSSILTLWLYIVLCHTTVFQEVKKMLSNKIDVFDKYLSTWRKKLEFENNDVRANVSIRIHFKKCIKQEM